MQNNCTVHDDIASLALLSVFNLYLAYRVFLQYKFILHSYHSGYEGHGLPSTFFLAFPIFPFGAAAHFALPY